MKSPTSFEGMIGRALLGDDKEKELQLIRIDCKHYAMQKMFCDCGNILDQMRTNILRDASGKDKAVCCDSCRAAAVKKLNGVSDTTGLRGWSFSNWDGKELILPKIEE